MTGAIIEFRGGCGGQESSIFGAEMKEIFKAFLRSKGIQVSEQSDPHSKILKLKAVGSKAYNYIRHESGVHKVIRVPETETKGRLHSSTITLLVLPDVPFNFSLLKSDLKIEFTTAQGPGGQHVNKTESACRITHIPSEISVLIQEYRNQHQNKAKALDFIKEKVYQFEFQKKMEADFAHRKTKMGTGDRSEKIRTYNFQQDRITDHRLHKTVFGMTKYLNSGLIFEECIEEMILNEKADKLKELELRVLAFIDS